MHPIDDFLRAKSERRRSPVNQQRCVDLGHLCFFMSACFAWLSFQAMVRVSALISAYHREGMTGDGTNGLDDGTVIEGFQRNVAEGSEKLDLGRIWVG